MKKGKILVAALGAALLVGLVVRIGPATLAGQLAVLRWCLPVLLAIGLVKLGLRTWSWRLALAAEGVAVSARQLLGASLASQSMAYLSVMGPFLGEPMKPLLLRNCAAVEVSTPATLADTSLYWLSSVTLGLAGTVSGIWLAANGAASLVILVASVALFAATIPLLLTRTALVPLASTLLCKWKGRAHRLCSLLRKAEELEDRMRSFRVRHPGTARRMFFLDLLVQVAMAAEVLTVTGVLGIHVGIFKLLALEAANRMVKILSFYVPGRVGADEGGAAGSFLLLGMDPAAGFTLAIARRAQALIWVAVGLAWLSVTGSCERRKEESCNAGSALVTRTP